MGIAVEERMDAIGIKEIRKSAHSDYVKLAHDIAEALAEKGMISPAPAPRYRRMLDVVDVIMSKLSGNN